MAGATFVSPTGYVDLDNDCQYSIDLKSTRSREYVDPKEDLAFYFNTYITPKYGLDNLNVSNVASFMKDLEMNWSKLTPELKDKVLDIMVEILFKDGYDFKNRFLAKLGVNKEVVSEKSSFGKSSFGKSSFGASGNYTVIICSVLLFILIIIGCFYFNSKLK